MKTLALFSACITMILIISTGVMGIKSMQEIIYISEAMSDEYSLIDELKNFEINTGDSEEVIAFLQAYNDEIAKTVFTTGHNSIILFINALTLTFVFSLATAILTILIKVKSKKEPSNERY